MPERPNIVYILADDMGYGDLAANNPASRIPTPNMDRLAARGMRFTDAHAASSVCTPSRYNILTGRCCWRSRLKRDIVWPWDGALLEPGRPTVASFLRGHGYQTACIGKWHLGWDWPTRDGRHPNQSLPFGGRLDEERARFATQIDLSGRIGGGPVDRGFDTYFGVDVPNFPPYTWFEDDHLLEIPTADKPQDMYGLPGKALPGWSLEAMIPEFTRRAVDYIETRPSGSGARPYFLYFPLTSPHSPIVPNPPFKGRSGIGNYGDFVCEVDWLVGEVMDALERAGTADNTLLILTSDNGPEDHTADDAGVYERARIHNHYSMGPLRGIKRDLWEGGHRTPFIASWPARVSPGTACPHTISLGDLMATLADILGKSLPPDAGEDSVSFLPLLLGEASYPLREYTIHHSQTGCFAIRQGDWVFIDHESGLDPLNIAEPMWFQQERRYQRHACQGELFNLADDLAERRNRYVGEPGRVREMAAALHRIRHGPAAR